MDKDIEIQQILHELGIKQAESLTDSQERLLEQALDPEKQFLQDVERLFEKDNTTFNDLFGEKNKWIKLIYKKHKDQLKQNLYVLIDNAYGPIGGHSRIKDPDSILDPELTYWQAIDNDADPEADAVLFGKETPHGVKILGWGHDGSGKRILLQKAEAQLSKRGYYFEAARRPAQLFLDMDIPYVTEQSDIEQIYKEQVQWLGNGRYIRQHSPDIQITFGNPIL